MIHRGPATFKEYYQQPYNAIVQPHRFLYYFRRRWMRELGPVGTSIVIYLRGLCYHNPDKGELRNTCECKLEDIGEAIGVSRATIARELGEHSQDDEKKGVKKGEPVNPALQQFVARQQQYNLTERGVRRTVTLYHVSMDEPLHPEDQPQYEILCLEYAKRLAEASNGLKPVYKTVDINANSGEGEGENPKSQNETKDDFTEPKSHFETGRREPKSQNETAIESYSFATNGLTLNVQDSDKDNKPRREGRGTTGNTASGSGSEPIDITSELIEGRVKAIVETLNDSGSIRRYRQLVGICERNNLLSLVDVALAATEAKRKKGPIEKPGAYFQTILLKHLEKRNVHVPTAAEAMEGKNVAATVAASLGTVFSGLGSDESSSGSGLPSVDLPGRTGLQAKPDELTSIAALEKAGGSAWQRWRQYLKEQRDQYVKESAGMPANIREPLLASLDQPEKLRFFWREWQKAMR